MICLCVHASVVLIFVTICADALRLGRDITTESKAGGGAKRSPRIFCFTFEGVYARLMDTEAMQENMLEFSACDGHAIFTDTNATGYGEVRYNHVDVPQSVVPRSENLRGFLLGRNMVGLIPAWKKLYDSKISDSYDWFVNSELDHIMRPSMIRKLISESEASLSEGDLPDRPKMMIWGNVFLFNKAMVLQMHKQSDMIFKTVPWPANATSVSARQDLVRNGFPVGCPEFLEGDTFWPGCAQDIAYPIIAKLMNVPISGAPSKNEDPCRFGNWDFSQTELKGWDTKEEQLKVIQRMAEIGSHEEFYKPRKSHESFANGTSTIYISRIREALEMANSFRRPKAPFTISLFSQERHDKVAEALQDLLHSEQQSSAVLSKCITPSKDTPFLHHAKFPAVFKLAYEKLGL